MVVRVHWSLENRPYLQFVARAFGAASPSARFAACPKCRTTHVRQLLRPDTLDRFVFLPWTLFLMCFGGRLYRCGACQVQFYDCRHQAPISITNHNALTAPAKPHAPVLHNATP